jgi:hypothetical protein
MTLRAALGARRDFLVGLTVALIWTVVSPLEAYLKFDTVTSTGVVTVKWNRPPVRYVVTDRGVPGVSASEFQAAVGRAFSTWQSVPTSSVSFDFGGFVGAVPFEEDGMTTLGFLDRPDLERVLGATGLTIDTLTGEIVEADIFFNAAFPWSVAANGEPDRFDLESIALHEIGHLVGLGHSAIGETEIRQGGGRRVIGAETVMFPVAFSPGSIVDRTLRADDVAAVSDLYPDGRFRTETGSVQGRVTKDGRGVFGAHVVAFSLRTGALIGAFTLNEAGEFAMAGLSPGPHVVRVEPLDDADIDGFFDDPGRVDVDFRIAFHDRVVVVPRGATAGPIEIPVKSK